jgi:ubiquinone/menaquinone biosynthesis C-methylase UbiE
VSTTKDVHVSDPFAEYYAQASLSEATLARFRSTKDAILRVRRSRRLSCEALDVADIGCGAATQCIIWANEGHRVQGMDVNEPLIEIGRRRVAEANLPVRLDVGTATNLPWESQSFDVCLLPELLEHVSDWRSCLREAARVLRPNGVLYISTTSRLCPFQSEFDLPLYSWYPGWLKRRCEKLAVTTHPQWVNHAQYPAVNWFDYFALRRAPELHGFSCLDRFDAVALADKTGAARLALNLVKSSGIVRWFAHLATPYTMIFAIRQA